MTTTTYKVGDIITYLTGGLYRTVTVEYKDDDIKNGRPGFDGLGLDGTTYWGYDEQIVRVGR